MKDPEATIPRTEPSDKAEKEAMRLLREVMWLLHDRVLLRNTEGDGDMQVYLKQAITLTGVLRDIERLTEWSSDEPRTGRV